MKISNRTAHAVIVNYGYKAFCEFRRMRLIGYGMEASLRNARNGGPTAPNEIDENDAALGFDVVGSIA